MRERRIKILMYLPLVLAIFALGFMDERIPMHYDFAGNVDRWGSPLEIFILPLATLAFGYFLLGMKKIALKKEKNAGNNEKYILLTIASCLIIFNIINILIIYSGLAKLERLELNGVGFAQIILGLTGLLHIFLGAKIPKIKRNEAIGLRTKWSDANDLVWEKSQRIAGIILILMGVLILVPIVFKIENLLVYLLTLTALCVSSMIFSSYIIYKKYGDIEDK